MNQSQARKLDNVIRKTLFAWSGRPLTIVCETEEDAKEVVEYICGRMKQFKKLLAKPLAEKEKAQ